ncbi:MAG: hypothetical protein KDE33_13185 [Bacteroidetes bacterium]|nr:hypothetical protein [Bacteroidota bacterium]
MSKKKSVNIQFEIDLNSMKTIGKVVDSKTSPKIDELNQQLAKSISKAFDSLTDWINDITELLNQDKHKEAYKLFEENKGTLQFLKTNVVENLSRLDVSVLNKAERKDFLLLLIALASRETNFGKIEKTINDFYTEFENEIEPEVKQSIILAKANAAAQNEKLNLANTYYTLVAEHDDTSGVDKAFAYRGLAKTSNFQEDVIVFYQKSADKFLEVGRKREAIKDLCFISELLEKENPNEALAKIDFAIEIYDSEKSLDKELLGSLYHRKASYLYSIGQTSKALDAVEQACKLRENLIGNEYERYSSYTSARLFSHILKNEEKEKLYTKKEEEVKPLIDSEEFRLQEKISSRLSKQEEIEGDLLEEVEKSEYSNFIFSVYLHNSIITKSPIEIKLEWIDKAKIVLEKYKFYNTHYSLLYYTLAEIYRQEGIINKAIENYEKSLEYNPLNYQAIQNCGATLWNNKLWDKSIIFFQNQLDKLGESPNLCYALGRSFFEKEKYQNAFNYFIKANGKVKGANIQEYINKCIEKNNNLQLPSNDAIEISQSAPISLESFRTTLEQFAFSVSSNSRMHFWKNIKGNYKWDSNPEERGKQLLVTAFETKYGKNAIEIIQERKAGAGIIDLYIILQGGLKIVVELKICGGAGYSSNYALSGKDQLIHYIKNTQTKIGFLIVFDGRMRDFGKGFIPIQSVDDISIFTTAIDMRPKIEK